MIKNYQIQNKGGKGVIRIVGEINWWNNSGADFMRIVDKLIAEGVTDIEGYINTPGGSMFEANEIGNQISRFTGEKKVLLGALCASAGTTLSTYFDKGKVEASKNTQYMIHDPMSQPFIQHESDYDSDKALYINLRNNAIDQYHERTGIDKETLSEMMKVTTWMNAEEAKKKGFVDSISDKTAEMPSDTQNVFTKYNYSVPSMVNTALQKTTIENKKEKMNKENLAALGLPEDATDEQVNEAIENLKKNQKPVETPANTGADKNKDKAMGLLLNVAKGKGMDEGVVKAAAEKDFDVAHDMVMAAPEKANSTGGGIAELVAEMKKSNSSGTPSVRADWNLDKWTKEDPAGLQNMIKNNFDDYSKLFEAKYNKVPNKEDFNL